MLTVFSYGGGVQSTAALVLAAQGELACDAFLFANVGDDSENPATLRYLREVAMPYATAHGLALHELERVTTTQRKTLYTALTHTGTSTVHIPMRMSGNGAPGRRRCTYDFKITVVNKWVRQHGATKKHPATIMLGISMDEWQRMRNDTGFSYTRNTYPLIDRRLSRQDCLNLIARYGRIHPLYLRADAVPLPARMVESSGEADENEQREERAV